MQRQNGVFLGLVCGALLTACGGDPVTPPPPPPPPPPSAVSCGSQAVTNLAVGQHQVIDPVQTGGCVRVPAAGASGAEYTVVVTSGSGLRSSAGVSAGYSLVAGNPGSSVVAAPSVAAVDRFVAPRSLTAQELFHDALRRREIGLAADPGARISPTAAAPPAAVPPLVGDVRTFKTCANISCNTFADVVATARYVGTRAAIYMDNTVPTNDTLRSADYDELGRTFDDYHYPINAAAFGAESDLDNNQRIVILMTDAVNALTPDCANGRVLGYFFGLDLITTGSQSVNSNKGEVFYTFVPAPANSSGTCNAISRTAAVNNVKPTLIHELQHMISWNQRVIVGGGTSEETWLNEAMSHFAEELGGRVIPESECTAAGFSSCRSQYISSNIINSHDFMTDTEANFLVYPTSSNGTLEERGASWFFLRWVIDQFATDTLLGSDFTRGMVTGAGGAATFASRTGVPFATLVTEWLLAGYLDDRPGFTPLSPRMRLRSWGLRSIWEDSRNAQVFPNGFPLRPDSTSGTYSRTGTLRGGSGRHLRLIQQANGPAIDVQLRNTSGGAIDPAVVPRIGIVRVR